MGGKLAMHALCFEALGEKNMPRPQGVPVRVGEMAEATGFVDGVVGAHLPALGWVTSRL
jgi:hypothetical protein